MARASPTPTIRRHRIQFLRLPEMMPAFLPIQSIASAGVEFVKRTAAHEGWKPQMAEKVPPCISGKRRGLPFPTAEEEAIPSAKAVGG